MTTIRSITPDITIFNSPFSRFGLFKIGGRATAIRLANKDLIIFSPIQLSSQIAETLDSLGTVKYLIAPDVEHHIFLKEYAKKYPNAKIIGVEGLREKNKDLKFDKVYGGTGASDKANVGYEDEVEVCYFDGFINKDLALFHKKSRTLVEADLLFNLPAIEQYAPTSSGAGIMGILSPFKYLRPDSYFHKCFVWYAAAADREKMARDANFVAKWDFDRIIPCHGDVIETGGKKAWVSAYEWYLKGKTM